MDKFSLAGKVAAVTGAASGIGKSVSREFAQAGARVFILDVDSGGARSTAVEIQGAGGQAEPLSCDVSDQRQVLNAFGQIFSREGHLHILVNNAGVAHIGSVEKIYSEFQCTMNGFNGFHVIAFPVKF